MDDLGSQAQTAEFGPFLQQAVLKVWFPALINTVAEGKPWVFVADARHPEQNLSGSAEGLTMLRRLWPWTRIGG